ncbi:beta/gamma crystallin-related protein [Massilia sp. 2TAF26]|uniref:beta/gamma crystallin-related protein n=1 Tax=Massilia sp. 2TAF26 TaxID=3233012 RepID=UPI003F97F437
MKRLLAAAAVLATFAHAAFAGEITLFTDSNFRGPSVTINRDAYNLADIGFNDRASSIIVRSGVWQVCEDRDFGGYCAEFGPGEYRELPRFNDSISSLREVSRGGRGYDRDDRRGGPGWRGDRDDRGGPRGGDAVQLFSGQRFEGPAVSLSGDVRSLNDVGFNDRAGSIIIYEGRWEFCEHGDFRGQCVVYGPGRYPFLEGMNNRISSMRRVR